MTSEWPVEEFDIPEMTYDTIDVGEKVFDPTDGRFGTVLSKDETDPEWRMLEVNWHNDDEEQIVSDVSYVVPGMQIGVGVQLTTDDQLASIVDMITAQAEQAADEGENVDVDAIKETIDDAASVSVMVMVEWD